MRLILTAIFLLTTTWVFFYQGRAQGCHIQAKIRRIEQQTPDIVFIGNSILRAALDPEVFSTKTALRTLSDPSNGSAAAYWYLYTKNIIAKTKHKPLYVAYCFRDHFLTDPAFRTHGSYLRPIRTLSTTQEPKLTAILSQDANYGIWSSPLSWVPSEAKRRLDNRIGKIAANILGISKHVQRQAINDIFTDTLGAAQMESEWLKDPKRLDFKWALERSLLPDMIQLVKNAGIQPIFIRMKRRQEHREADDYIQNLSSYLASQDILFIDFADEKSIVKEHFGPGDHLNAKGKVLFTELLSRALHIVVDGIHVVDVFQPVN